MTPEALKVLINVIFDLIEEKTSWRPFGGFFLNWFRTIALEFADLILLRAKERGVK